MSIVGQYINDGMAQALGIMLTHTKQFQSVGNYEISEVNLDDNGLKDDSFAKILTALIQFEDLSMFSYSNNQLGPKSVELFGKIISRSPPNALKELRISGIKCSQSTLARLLQIVENSNHIKKLKISYL